MKFLFVFFSLLVSACSLDKATENTWVDLSKGFKLIDLNQFKISADYEFETFVKPFGRQVDTIPENLMKLSGETFTFTIEGSDTAHFLYLIELNSPQEFFLSDIDSVNFTYSIESESENPMFTESSLPHGLSPAFFSVHINDDSTSFAYVAGGINEAFEARRNNQKPFQIRIRMGLKSGRNFHNPSFGQLGPFYENTMTYKVRFNLFAYFTN